MTTRFDLPPVVCRAQLHPSDEPRLRALSETLFEISAGRLRPSRPDILHEVETLMLNTRQHCRLTGAYGVVDRVLAIADHRLGAAAIGDVVLAEIALVEAGAVR